MFGNVKRGFSIAKWVRFFIGITLAVLNLSKPLKKDFPPRPRSMKDKVVLILQDFHKILQASIVANHFHPVLSCLCAGCLPGSKLTSLTALCAERTPGRGPREFSKPA